MVEEYIDQILVVNSGQEGFEGNNEAEPPRIVDSQAGVKVGFGPFPGSDEQALVPFEGLDSWLNQQSWDDVAMQFSDNFAIDYTMQ